MNKELLNLAKQATEEEWDAFRIMAEMIALQKEVDAKICEQQGNVELATIIRNQ